MSKTVTTHIVGVLAKTQTKHLQKRYSLNQLPWFVVLTCREKGVIVCYAGLSNEYKTTQDILHKATCDK
jgi:hypothetical protein